MSTTAYDLRVHEKFGSVICEKLKPIRSAANDICLLHSYGNNTSTFDAEFFVDTDKK